MLNKKKWSGTLSVHYTLKHINKIILFRQSNSLECDTFGASSHKVGSLVCCLVSYLKSVLANTTNKPRFSLLPDLSFKLLRYTIYYAKYLHPVRQLDQVLRTSSCVGYLQVVEQMGKHKAAAFGAQLSLSIKDFVSFELMKFLSHVFRILILLYVQMGKP